MQKYVVNLSTLVSKVRFSEKLIDELQREVQKNNLCDKRKVYLKGLIKLQEDRLDDLNQIINSWDIPVDMSEVRTIFCGNVDNVIKHCSRRPKNTDGSITLYESF